MKPVNLILCSIKPTSINSYLVEKIEIDLRHINYGLNSEKGYAEKARSNFRAEDIIEFFESLDGLEADFEIDGYWQYFVVDKPFFKEKKIYRMVFCIDYRESNIAGIITFFQIKRGNK